MPFENLPGIFDTKQDGNLTIPNTNGSPIVCVLGTASQGDSESLFSVTRLNDAARVFGKAGTLVRGMYEAAATGANNVRLFRIGATPAVLSGVGETVTIETDAKHDSTGYNYKLWFVASTGRIRIFRSADGTLVYDSGDGTLDTRIDLGEVTVSGVPTGGVNVGT